MLDTREKLLDIREKPDGRLLVKAKPLVSSAYLMPPPSMPHLAGDVIPIV